MCFAKCADASHAGVCGRVRAQARLCRPRSLARVHARPQARTQARTHPLLPGTVSEAVDVQQGGEVAALDIVRRGRVADGLAGGLALAQQGGEAGVILQGQRGDGSIAVHPGRKAPDAIKFD